MVYHGEFLLTVLPCITNIMMVSFQIHEARGQPDTEISKPLKPHHPCNAPLARIFDELKHTFLLHSPCLGMM